MSLLVYKISDYEHTAEREQYRCLCKLLQSKYGKTNDICIFIANYNIFDSELDGILIKPDAIIAIEFKNYGGNLTALENGHWKLDNGTIVKGGSRKSVYQQAKLNHVAIKQGFTDGSILPTKMLRNIQTLIVFHQPINLDNRLSAKVRSWLFICDETNFLEKVSDITSAHLALSNADLLTLLPKLNLTEDFLDEDYSNSEIIQEEPSYNNADELISDEDDKKQCAPNELDETRDLKAFLSQILDILLNKSAYSISILKPDSAGSILDGINFETKSTYVVILASENIVAKSEKISRFINREIYVIDNNRILWNEKIDQSDCDVKKITSSEKDVNTIAHRPHGNLKRKSKTSLPHWLDRYIFNELAAEYAPEYSKFNYNLNLTESELKIYLGTYFPRSYSELFCIANNLFENQSLRIIMEQKSSINILDLGCGTGGELLGLLVALSKYFESIKQVNIIAIDGNKNALQILKAIINEFSNSSTINVNIQTFQSVISDRQFSVSDFTNTSSFDFVICSKVACELKSHSIVMDAYAWLTRMLTMLLSETGLLFLMDITTKNELTGLFYPQEMNTEVNSSINQSEYKTLLPLACSMNADCNESCFIQQEFTISHSHKKNDISRICYKIICNKLLYSQVAPQNISGVKHLILSTKNGQDTKDVTCCKTSGEILIDSFNINI